MCIWSVEVSARSAPGRLLCLWDLQVRGDREPIYSVSMDVCSLQRMVATSSSHVGVPLSLSISQSVVCQVTCCLVAAVMPHLACSRFPGTETVSHVHFREPPWLTPLCAVGPALPGRLGLSGWPGL